MLDDKSAAKAGAQDKDYKLRDSGGLYLYVTKAGLKSWRLKYRFDGKEKLLVLGRFPDMKTVAAREARDIAKKLLSEGKDPSLHAKRVKLANIVRAGETFELFARQWYEKQKSQWKEVHAKDVITSMEKDLFPDLGQHPITEINEAMLLATLRKVEKRGAIETARRLRQRAERVFKFAKVSGAGNGNPADGLDEVMMPVPPGKRWPAIVDIVHLRELVRDVDRAGANPVTRLASRFMGLTGQRPGMIRTMPWSEFHGIDWLDPNAPVDEAMWIIPPQRMKIEFKLRDDDDFTHRVPLAPQTVEVLRAVRRLTGRGTLVFPNNRDATTALSENSVGYLYNRKGYKGQHCPHGWRSSFSTIMNELAERRFRELGFDERTLNPDRLIIDYMLAHRPTGMSATEFKYNRARFMPRRREIAIEWADMLTLKADPAASLLEGPRRENLR
ncbi:MAG: integrase arm-type DNA-binding domain-containing protein [Pseudomonadota bacterium]